MKAFLGVDGGGTKTDFLLIDEGGRVLARHRAGSAYYPETGIDALQHLLEAGISATLQQAGVTPAQVRFGFIGLPAYGEDSVLMPRLDSLAATVLEHGRYRCGNDVVCGWAGALACRDGINLVAGTGSIAYGEWEDRQARAGGWGELFSDEGSAYWVAREGLSLFSRMSDGRAVKGPLHDLIRQHFGLRWDLDLGARVYGPPAMTRSELAGLAPLVAQAAVAGDRGACRVFESAARELTALIHAVRDALAPPAQIPVPVSYSGGMFQFGETLLGPLREALDAGTRPYAFLAPKLTPVAGAALYASRLGGTPLSPRATEELTRQCAAPSSAGERP